VPTRAVRALTAVFAALALLLVACEASAAPGPAASTPPAATAAPATPATAAPTAATATPAPQRAPVVVIDAGHAADEVGAAAFGIVEKDSNLDFARRVAAHLRARGVEPLLTRDADVRVTPPGGEATHERDWNGTRLDLQARVDLANAAGADAFVSIHSNGAPTPDIRGHEVYYNAARPFAADNRRLATLLLDGVSTELRAAGLPAMPRGVIDDACLKPFGGRCYPLFLLGPVRSTDRAEIAARGGTPEGLGLPPGEPALVSRASAMPGALVELLFISSPEDAALLRDETARDAMARGVARGVLEFLGRPWETR